MDKFEIHVDDNFHYMVERYRQKEGEYDTLDQALAKCKKIVNQSLVLNYREGMTGNQLWDCYKAYGVDPFIFGTSDVPFSAWTYAKEICLKDINSVKENYAKAGPEIREIMARNEAFDTFLTGVGNDIKGIEFTSRVKRH